MDYNEIEMGALVEQIIGEYIYIFNKEGLSLEKYITDKDIILKVDIDKIVRAIENLLTNAIKYSREGSKVIVKLVPNDENLVFSISNETDNLKEEDLENIFQRFYKVDKARKKAESSGLGLSIVQRIIELHGGTIKAELINDIITFKLIIPYQFK